MGESDQELVIPRVLFCAHALVPGPSAAGSRLNQLISAFSDELEVDALTLKGADLGHIQRLGAARMLRVPVGTKSFKDALGSYQRALTRQLEGDAYNLVYCGDIFSAEIAAGFKKRQGFSLHLELDDIPATSFERRYPVEKGDAALKKKWKVAQRTALMAADKIIVMSRYAARVMSEHADPRKVIVVGRAVDRHVFSPPSVEIDLDGRKTVAVFERRGPKARVNSALATLNAISRKTRDDEVRLMLVGAPSEFDQRVDTELRRMEIRDRVEIVDTDSAVSVAAALSLCDVVVVPTSAESQMVPFAIPHRALEAMACRRATIVTGPASTFRDVITPSVHAVIAPASTPNEVARHVLDLLDDDEVRSKLANAGEMRVGKQCDLETRNEDFAKMMSAALGVTLSPRKFSDDDSDDLSHHAAPVPVNEGAQNERAITAMRPLNELHESISSTSHVWASGDDVIEISESSVRRAPTGASFRIPLSAEGANEGDPRGTLSDDLGSVPDVRPVPIAPSAPRRHTIDEPSTESGAFMGAPKGEPLKLPHFAKALQVPLTDPNPSEDAQSDPTGAENPTASMTESASDEEALMPPPLQTSNVNPHVPPNSVALAPNPQQKPPDKRSLADSAPPPQKPPPLRRSRPPAKTIVPRHEREPTIVAGPIALELVEQEKNLRGREQTMEMPKAFASRRRSQDEWAPDTVADATPFEAKPVTVRAGDNGKTKDRGLLVERDPPDITVEDTMARSSGDDVPSQP